MPRSGRRGREGGCGPGGCQGACLDSLASISISPMEPLLVEAFRYNKWANLHLIEVCEGFSEEQLQMTSPGTYGTLAATFLHLLAAEQRYLRRPGVGEPQIIERQDTFPCLKAQREHPIRTVLNPLGIHPRPPQNP